MRKFYLFLFSILVYNCLTAQTPVPMSSQPGLTYTENFADIANWTNGFAAGTGANRFASVPVNATGTIPDGVRISTTTATFVAGTTGGLQRGTQSIVLLSTGTADNSTSDAFDFFMDFTGVNAGTLSFDWASVNNSTGDRKGSLRIYYSTDGTTFTELPAAQVLNFTNNVLTSGSITTVALPAAFNNSATARLRFYYHNGTGGTTGSRPKVSIDNLTVTAASSSVSTVAVTAGTNAAEPSTNGTFTIDFSSPTTASTDINFDYTGTAGFGTDYTVSYSTGTTASVTSSGTLTVPSGISSVTVTVTPIDDIAIEGTENISLTLSAPGGGYVLGTASAAINLADNDVATTVSVAAGTNAAEPASNGTFTVTLSTPAPAGDVTINYTLAGTASAGDYTDPLSGSITIVQGNTIGTITLNVIDDAVFEGTETIAITLSNATNGFTLATSTATINLLDNETPPVSNIVINQVYGGGGNSGAVYKNDFIELYNNESAPVNLSGWSVQYTSATGSGTWTTTALTGTIPPHGFFLVQEGAGAGGTTALPAPDVTGTIAMGATAGKVLLSNSTVAQTGANPSGAGVVDKIGYAPTATGFETTPTAAPDNATGLRRVTDGADNNNNATDFNVSEPIPRNSTYTTTGPAIVSVSPPTGSTDVPSNTVLTIVFDKPITKGTGNITVFEDGIAGTPIDVTTSAVTLTDSRTATINTVLSGGKSYYIQINAGAFKDVYENNFAGIANTTTWAFTTYNSSVPVGIPVSFDFQNCTGSGLLPNGFTQYSVGGAIVWDCTPFGRDPAAPNGTAAFPNAVQMNGFANGTNIPNIDWLISPSLNLTGTTFPLLSFWSRTAFNGPSLQLKVSTDYTGGNPLAATWTDVNGKFPVLASNIWTLSSDINLTAFKQANVHFAFVYTSTDDEGARWTMDDVSVINSATPPPPSLTVSTTDLQYTFVANGTAADKTFTFTGNDLTADISLSASGDFLLSKDGTSFSSSLLYTVAEADNITKTVFVRFAPTQANQNFTGTVLVSTASLSSTINLKGTSIDPATTLEVVNWNMEWFGSTDPTLGPTNDELQEQNATTILQSIKADLFALVEVVDESRLAHIVSQMPGYSYVICNYGSHTNTNESGASPLTGAQKEAFVYKTSMFSNITTTPLLSQGINSLADLSNPAYNYWSSGRFPFLMSADVTLNCVTKNIKFVLVHAKANTSPTATAYARRKSGADSLYYTLNTLFPNDNIVILGDFNDDLDQSITAGFTTTSWNSFTTDPVNFTALTLPLSLAGKKSTTGFNDMIDHVIASNEMAPYYMPATASVLNDVTSLVSNYGSTTSDHFPVFTRYKFELPPPPVITCPENVVKNNDPGVCGAAVNYTLTVTGNCGTVTTQQTQGLASGSVFPVGTTTNTFIVTDAAGGTATCSFTVTVNDTENPTISCPGNITRNTDPGTCGTVVNYIMTFADNCPGATIQQTTGLASGAVFPDGVTTNTFVVTDLAGHTSTCSFTVTVTDNEAPTFTRPANKTIPFTGTCTYDAGVAVTGDVTNEHDNCSTGLQATFTDQVTSCGNIVTILRTWKLADAKGNQAPAQVQTITVSDNNTPYIVYATKEAHFDEYNLINGSVGVTSSTGIAEFKKGTVLASPDFVKAKNVSVAPGAFVPNRILSAATDGPNPSFFLFSGTTSSLPNKTITASTSTPVSANYKELRIKKNVTVTITGTLYGNIIIEEGAQVTFTPAGGIINIGDMKIDGTLSSGTRIKFGACTSVRVQNVVEIGRNVQLNANGPKVTFYLGDNNTDDEKFIVDDGLTIISVNIYIKKGELRITSNGDLVAMKGWFIVEKLISQARYMIWDDNDCNASGATQPFAKSPETIKSPETEEVTSSLAVTASPNPSTDQFTLSIQSSSLEPITLRIVDVSGRILFVRPGVTPNSTVKTGAELRNGVYFAEVMQGKDKKVVKLIKL